ncbi:unnamed protein product [Arctia plantaginis]|uniref:Uncharacterized protein n=1 Tax=Arctia plantaginis TaxID=874455 RepID=A0A8S1B1I0_ARCPL|nr:unnamed protein product [Arctia plantaginis]
MKVTFLIVILKSAYVLTNIDSKLLDNHVEEKCSYRIHVPMDVQRLCQPSEMFESHPRIIRSSIWINANQFISHHKISEDYPEIHQGNHHSVSRDYPQPNLIRLIRRKVHQEAEN